VNNQATTILLASASPRRQQLLQQLGWPVRVQPVDIDETPLNGELPDVYCLRMAEEKAREAIKRFGQGNPVLASDTTVVLEQDILGKPDDAAHAVQMLQQLSGRNHQVMTAVSVGWQDQLDTVLSVNQVWFDDIPAEQIKAYVASGEPMDKAGAYGIQGLAAQWIRRIEGSYSAIMGLPLFETSQLLNKGDIISPLDVLQTKSSR
jgi:septum formation protein